MIGCSDKNTDLSTGMHATAPAPGSDSCGKSPPQSASSAILAIPSSPRSQRVVATGTALLGQPGRGFVEGTLVKANDGNWENLAAEGIPKRPAELSPEFELRPTESGQEDASDSCRCGALPKTIEQCQTVALSEQITAEFWKLIQVLKFALCACWSWWRDARLSADLDCLRPCRSGTLHRANTAPDLPKRLMALVSYGIGPGHVQNGVTAKPPRGRGAKTSRRYPPLPPEYS